jgi:transcription antitermination protein NusB
MGARTTAREAALQMLFAIDSTGAPAAEVIRDYWREMPGDAEGRAYADELVRGVVSDLTELDGRIRTASTNWRLERMNRVDRNLLRLGAYELVHRSEVPRAVILDEAVEIAKRYGTDDSSAFINGVLDRVADDCGRVDSDRDRTDAEG